MKLIVSCFSMFIDIETFFLNALSNTQSVSILDAPEQKDSANGRPSVNCQNSKELCSQKTYAVTIKQSGRSRKQACQQSSKDSANAMYGTGSYRVVNMKFFINKLNGKNQHDATDSANGDGTDCRNL